MNSHIHISKRQKEIIVGKLLGDGHLETQTQGRSYRLKIEHSILQKAYVDWLYQELKSLAASPPQMKEQMVCGRVYQKYWFNTVATPSLRFFAQQFYHERKKVVPKMIMRWLTPIALAVWYMDDGSIKSKHHQAKIINTQSFSRADIELLMRALKERYGIESKRRAQKEGEQIYVLSKTIDTFRNVIGSYVLPSMRYKID